MAPSNPSLAAYAATQAPSARRDARVRDAFERHGEFLFRALRRMGVPEHGVEDALQQVFATYASRLDGIESHADRAFLFRTAMHVAAHARRSAARGREVATESLPEPVDPAPRADELVQRRRARALLDEVLDAMPLELRTVFVLFELEEMPTTDIAALIGIPHGTVASRLRRAREMFHAHAERVRKRTERCGRLP
jgi:RNA polymerase sigma-70 factor (ECF subfamily)